MNINLKVAMDFTVKSFPFSATQIVTINDVAVITTSTLIQVSKGTSAAVDKNCMHEPVCLSIKLDQIT